MNTKVNNKFENRKSRVHEVIVYPDNALQMQVFNEFIMNPDEQKLNGFRPFAINHVPETDEKKEHIHCDLVFDRSISSIAVRKMLGHGSKSGYQWVLYRREYFKDVTDVELTKHGFVKQKDKDGQLMYEQMTDASGKKYYRVKVEEEDVHRKEKTSNQDLIPVVDADGMPVTLPYLTQDPDIVDGSGAIIPSPDYVPMSVYDNFDVNCRFIAAARAAGFQQFQQHDDQIDEVVCDNMIWIKKEYWIFPHVEPVSDVYSRFIYFQHADHDSKTLGKTPYPWTDIYGDQDLINCLHDTGKTEIAPLTWIRDQLRSGVTSLLDLTDKALEKGSDAILKYISSRSYYVDKLITLSNNRHLQDSQKAKNQHEQAVDLFTSDETSKAINDALDASNGASGFINPKDVAQNVTNKEWVTRMFGLLDWLNWLIQTGTTLIDSKRIQEHIDNQAILLMQTGAVITRDVKNLAYDAVLLLAPTVGITVEG